jgi:hypothetical protein
MSAEEWRPVKGEPDYEVSSTGRVRCVAVRRYLKPGDIVSSHVGNNGYVSVSLNQWPRTVHRLVCAAFHGDAPPNRREVAHNNGRKTDNRAENLRWASRVENCADVKIHGTENAPKGQAHGRAVLTEEQAKDALRRVRSGETQKAVAQSLGVARTTVNAIACKRNWKHLGA